MAPRKPSTTSSLNMTELDDLMKEYPDWKEQFPQLYEQANPPRAYKARGDRVDKHLRFGAKTNNAPLAKTDYQLTYDRKNMRPRSSKRPPQTPRDMNPPPMSFETFQRSVFVPKDIGVRAEPIVFEDNYKTSTKAMDTKSTYQKDFPSTVPLPDISRAEPHQAHLKISPGAFNDLTTNKDSYKQWVSQPSAPFKELPVFTGSILYPSRSHELQTTTNNTFKGAYGPKADPFILSAANIKMEGDHDHDTTNAVTYKPLDGAKAATLMPQVPLMNSHQRGKLEDQTQTRKDFPGYGGKQPKPPNPAEPAPSTIHIRHNNQTRFQTEQQNQFQGVDASKHPRPPLVQKLDEYQPNQGAKFEGVSHVQMTYKPIDVREVYNPPVKAPHSTRFSGDNIPKFQELTSNKHDFQAYKVSARTRHGDFHENHHYVPPVEKFGNPTTTHDTFVPKSGEMRPPFVPADGAITKDGKYDFNTVNMVTYTQPSMAGKLDRSNAKYLLKQLRQRKDRDSKAAAQAVC